MDEDILPDFVQTHDLQADLKQGVAHEKIAGHINDFLQIQLGIGGTQNMQKAIQ